MALSNAAWFVALVGLTTQATALVEEARAALATTQGVERRLRLGRDLAAALVQLGRADEVMAVVSSIPEWSPSPSFVQLLVECGNIKHAQQLADQSADPLVSAGVASALLSANRMAVARFGDSLANPVLHFGADPPHAARSELDLWWKRAGRDRLVQSRASKAGQQPFRSAG